jgi:hypothetical protein
VGLQSAQDYLPRPEGDEEAHPREEENSSIFVDGVEDRNRPGLLIVWIEVWCGPELVHCEAHCEDPG